MDLKYTAHLHKMKTQLTAETVEYRLKVDGEMFLLNELIGKSVAIRFTNQINCKRCGKWTKKSFAQGFCYPCFANAPENSPCIIKPELCEAHLGKGRDVEWEKEHHLQNHVVYLAVSSGLKVGVTRHDQVPTRWIDQGASQAIRLATVPYRQLAGRIEVILKKYVSDRTNWQRMLKNMVATDIDLIAKKQEMKALLPKDLQSYIAENNDITTINYPVIDYPTKLKSLSFDKIEEVTGTLMGIKGQYLIFDGGRVMNIRKHAGYLVEWRF